MTANGNDGSAATKRNLPVRPSRYVPTTMVSNVKVVVQLAVRTGGCSLIDGPVGLGKTTAVVEAARDLGFEAVYVDMFGTTTHRDQLDAIWKAMTGTPGVGRASNIRDDILATLRLRTITLLIDEAHRVGRDGLSPLLAIWNRLHAQRGKGTPMVFCGNNLENHLEATLPELLSRASTCYRATPLAGKALVPTILKMEPRIAGTDPGLIKRLDTRHIKGSIRRWDQFFDLLCELRGPDTEPAPVTDDELDMIVTMMPRSVIRGAGAR